MRKIRILISVIIFVMLLNIAKPIYADDELEETSITIEEMDEILEATSNLEEVPVINSRNAVVYDRASRKSIIWKARRYKMQDGLYDKNYEFDDCGRKCKKFERKSKSIRKSSRYRRF